MSPDCGVSSPGQVGVSQVRGPRSVGRGAEVLWEHTVFRGFRDRLIRRLYGHGKTQGRTDRLGQVHDVI